MFEKILNRRRVFVFGDSNSILADGWLVDLRKALQDDFEVINRSIGGTSSLMGYYRAVQTKSMTEGDIAIWAYAINDFCQYTSGTSLEILIENFAWFISECQSRGVHVLPVVMKTRNQAGNLVFDPFVRSYTRFLKSNDMIYVNCDEILKRHGRKAALLQYQDGLHLLSGGWQNQSIAMQVKEYLNDSRFSNAVNVIEFDFLKVRKLKIFSDGPTGSEKTFKNSLIEENYYSIPFNFENVPDGLLKAIIVLTTGNGGATNVISKGRTVGPFSLINQGKAQGEIEEDEIKYQLNHVLLERSKSRRGLHVCDVVEFVRSDGSRKTVRAINFGKIPNLINPKDGIVALIVAIGNRGRMDPKISRSSRVLNFCDRLVMKANKKYKKFFG